MRNFFVPKRGLNFSEVSLGENRISFMPYNIDGHDGWIFDEATMNNVCRLYNLTIQDTHTTTIDGLVRAIVASAQTEAEVAAAAEVATLATVEETVPVHQVSDINMNLAVFEEKIGKKILVHVLPEPTHIKPIKDDNFHIWMYATPDAKKKPDQPGPRLLFDLRWSHELYSFSPSSKGTIITDLAGSPVAELVNGNNLYVLHHLRYIDNPRKPDFKVLQNLIIKVTMGDEEWSKMARQFNFDQIKDNFTEFCKKMEFKRFDEIKNSVTQLKLKVAETGAALFNYTRDLKCAEREMVMYTSESDKQVAAYHREFDRIRANPKVINLEITDQDIIASTVPLICEDPRNGALYSMGQYRLKINMSPNNFGLHIENLTRKIDRKSHPHVAEDGKPCMGNFNEAFQPLVNANEYSSLIIMAIKFIESCQPEDQWGATIIKWPLDPSSPYDPNEKDEKKRKRTPAAAVAPATEQAVLREAE